MKDFFLKVILPEVLIEIFGRIMFIPVVSNVFSWVGARIASKLIDRGVLKIKTSLIDLLSSESKQKYAPVIELLLEAQSKDALTEEEELEYEKRLKAVVRGNRVPLL